MISASRSRFYISPCSQDGNLPCIQGVRRIEGESWRGFVNEAADWLAKFLKGAWAAMREEQDSQ